MFLNALLWSYYYELRVERFETVLRAAGLVPKKVVVVSGESPPHYNKLPRARAALMCDVHGITNPPKKINSSCPLQCCHCASLLLFLKKGKTLGVKGLSTNGVFGAFIFYGGRMHRRVAPTGTRTPVVAVAPCTRGRRHFPSVPATTSVRSCPLSAAEAAADDDGNPNQSPERR